MELNIFFKKLAAAIRSALRKKLKDQEEKCVEQWEEDDSIPNPPQRQAKTATERAIVESEGKLKKHHTELMKSSSFVNCLI